MTCGGSNAHLLRLTCQNLKKEKEKKRRRTSENTGITIEDAPATFKSFVWQHFGYPAEMINGNRVTDKTRTICKHCLKIVPYTTES